MTERPQSRHVGQLVASRATGCNVQSTGRHDPRLDRARCALHEARCASGPMNAVEALTGALAGARFGAAAIPSRLLDSVPLATHARVLRAAAALLEQRDCTLTSVTS